MFSSRNPDELKEMADSVGAKAGTVTEAADHGEVLLLATPLKHNEVVANEVGTLRDKILIDATNPYPNRDGAVAQKIVDDEDKTSTEYTASLFTGATTVKAFNSVFYKVMQERAFQKGDERVAIQIVADDEQAKTIVKNLIEDIGMAPHDLGGFKEGKKFEPEAPLYNKNLTIKEAQQFVKDMM